MEELRKLHDAFVAARKTFSAKKRFLSIFLAFKIVFFYLCGYLIDDPLLHLIVIRFLLDDSRRFCSLDFIAHFRDVGKIGAAHEVGILKGGLNGRSISSISCG